MINRRKQFGHGQYDQILAMICFVIGGLMTSGGLAIIWYGIRLWKF